MSLSKQKIPTTEYGVERAVKLGLDANYPVLVKAFRYLASVTGGYRDRPGKDVNWPAGIRLIIASTMARIQPDSPLSSKMSTLAMSVMAEASTSRLNVPKFNLDCSGGLTRVTRNSTPP